jgi:Tfp pilus assembly pilus retraction ATPase PilT
LMSIIESSSRDGMLAMSACLDSYVKQGLISAEDRHNFDSGS